LFGHPGLYDGIASAVQDAHEMGVKVQVAEHESLRSAVRRHWQLVHLLTPSTRKKGPFQWMVVTKAHYQKPSLLKRMKRLGRKHNTRILERLTALARDMLYR
jgi:hypothetical protein